MGEIQTVLKTAAKRLYMTGYLARLHVVALVLTVAALLAVLMSKAMPALVIPWQFVGPALVGVGLVLAFGIWWRHRQNELQVAVAVDERLDLREKLSTALHVARRDDAFARAAVEDAVSVARDARTREAVRRRFPVEFPRHWWVAPLIAIVAVAIGSFMPQGDLFAEDAEQQQVIRPVSTEVTDTLNSTIEQIQQNPDLANELNDVLEDLNPSTIDPEALRSPEGDRREAIKKLSSLKERLDEIMEGEQAKTLEALERAMSDLKMPTEEGLAKDMMEAMAKGDFEAAQNALQQMQEQALNGEMDPQQAEKLAEQLNQLAQQMQQLAQQQKALEEALEQAGLDPNLAQNPQQLQQQLQQNQQLTQQQKQQLQQMAQAQQQAQQMCQGMGQAMQQMAQAMAQMGQGQGGQQGQNQQQMQQGGQQAQQMLNDLEAMQQMLKQAQAMAGQCQGQCEGLGQGLGQRPGMGQPFGGQGRGAGGEAPIAQTPTRTSAEKANNQNDQADIISNLPFDGPIIRGESELGFKQAAMSAAQSYAENVNDDQVPRRYKEAMQHYFGDRMREYGEGASSEGESGDTSSSSESNTEGSSAGESTGE